MKIVLWRPNDDKILLFGSNCNPIRIVKFKKSFPVVLKFPDPGVNQMLSSYRGHDLAPTNTSFWWSLIWVVLRDVLHEYNLAID